MPGGGFSRFSRQTGGIRCSGVRRTGLIRPLRRTGLGWAGDRSRSAASTAVQKEEGSHEEKGHHGHQQLEGPWRGYPLFVIL